MVKTFVQKSLSQPSLNAVRSDEDKSAAIDEIEDVDDTYLKQIMQTAKDNQNQAPVFINCEKQLQDSIIANASTTSKECVQ